MVFIVKFEGAFQTKEEAFAFMNLIEGVKDKFSAGVIAVRPGFSIGRILQVWESTHDEATPLPCKLIAEVDFSSVGKLHTVDGVVPSAELVIPSKVVAEISAKAIIDKPVIGKV